MYGVLKQVKCIENGLCSQKVVTVVIIEECPGGIYSSIGKRNFDLMGTPFTNLESPGTSSTLLNTGVVSILFQW